MKRLFTLILIALTTLSCEVIDEKLDDLLDKRDWVVFADGTELTVDVPSKQTVLNYKFESTLDWELTTESEWLKIDPTSGKAGKDIKIQIKVSKNKDKEGRTGYVDLTLSNDESYRITVNQAGEGDENDDIIVDIPNNEIWYTSTDGEIVEPYSGEYNNNADALTTFGVNIVSNTYKDGKGVIEFDGDVTKIGRAAFLWCPSLRSVTIPGSVTTIGEMAFQKCESLTSVNIPDSVTEIGYYVFTFCTSLTSFNGKFASEDNRCLIVNGELVAFAPAGLTEYTIPDSVTSIRVGAFYDCNSLTSVTIPGSVTTIGDNAFYNCYSLNAVYITDLSAWCRIDFSNKESNPLTFAHNLYLNNDLVTDLTIPSDITVIKDYSFFSGNSILNINLHNGITSVGVGAFVGCGIQGITIPDSITEIKHAAFTQCPYLTEFKGKFATEDGLALIVDGTFHAFANGSGITDYTIPEGVATIGASAFNKAYSLKSVTIPDSVTVIVANAFYQCINLNDTYCRSAIPPYLDVYVFWNSTSQLGCNIYVPAESYYNYISAEGWRDYAEYIVAYDFEKGEVVEVEKPELGNPDEIENNQIWYTSYGGGVYINRPEAFNAAIVSNIWYGDYGVITFDEELTTIGDFAFTGAYNLCTLTLPGSVVSVGECIVKDCNSFSGFMGKFATEDGSALIANGVFVACAQSTVAEEYIVPDGVTRIATCAFRECENISKIVIPQSVESIGEGAFSSSLGIQSFEGKFVTDDSLAVICDNTLIGYAHGNPNRSYAIPEGVTRIGWYALDNSIYLEEVTIPETVTEIGDVSFAFCYSLQRVYCKPTTPPIALLDDNMGWEAFSYNGYQMQIYVPAESYLDYISAEGWSQYAASILPYDYDNNCVAEVDPSEETKRWLGKWSSTVSRTYCPQTGFNEETVSFEVSIAHDGVLPNAVKIYGLSVIDPTIAVYGIVNANGDLEILNFNYIGNSGEWNLYVWALSEAMSLSFDRHAVYTMSMDESGNVSCDVGSLEGSPYIVFDIFGYNVNTGNLSWYDTNISYYSGPMSWVKIADNGATPSRSSQKISYRHNLRPQADARLRVVE